NSCGSRQSRLDGKELDTGPHPLARIRLPERTPVMSDLLSEWWFTLLAWWQELTPDSRGFLRGVAVLLGAFLAGQVPARMARRRLRDSDFDASLRPPWLPSVGGGRAEARPFTPTGLVSGLVRCTAWGAGVWWLATEQGWVTLARTLEWTAGRVWSLAAVLIVA